VRGSTAAAPGASRGISWLHLVPVALLFVWSLALARAERPYPFIDWVNLAFHEAGHLFLRPFGQTLHILGGTLMQLFVPALLVGYFLLKQEKPFSSAICLWWFGENFINISVYMADARDLKLALVGGGEHDWTQLFYQFGLLGPEPVARIAAGTHHLGVLVMLAAVAWAGAFALPPEVRASLRDRLAEKAPALGGLLGPEAETSCGSSGRRF